MRRQAVESTTVRSIGYNARHKVLEIEFRSGTVYQYLDVPEAVHEEFRVRNPKANTSTSRSGTSTSSCA